MTFMRDVHQRLNQANSAAGWPAVLDFSDRDEMSDTIARTLSFRIGELDRNSLAQCLAGEFIENVIRPDGVAVDMDTRWNPRFDEMDLFSTRLIGVVYRTHDTYVRVPMTDPEQWREIGVAYLNSETHCQAHLQPECEYFSESWKPLDLQCYPIKRGEHVAIIWMCAHCRERLTDPHHSVDIQSEPQPWIDEGPNFEGDPFGDADPWA